MVNKRSKIALIVLGPHRSGTSALSAAIHAGLKVDFGKHLIPPSYDNPKGFFENEKIVEFNEALLGVLLCSWDDPHLISNDECQTSKVEDLRETAKQVILREYNKNSTCICIKDPRMCKTLPFWQEVLEDLGYDLKVAVNYRSPNEIGASLKKRNLITIDHSDLLTASYYISAIRNIKSLDVLYVSFDDLIADSSAVVNKIADHFSLSALMQQAVNDNIVDATLRHYKSSKEGIEHQYNRNEFSLLYKSIRDRVTILDAEPFDEITIAEYETTLENRINTEWKDITLNRRRYATINLRDKNQYLIYSDIQRIDDDQVILNIDLVNHHDCYEIEIILANMMTSIEIIEIDAEGKDFSLKDNAISRYKKVLHFDMNHPKLLIKFKNSYRPSSIEVVYKLLDYKNDDKSKITKVDYGLGKALATIFTKPGRFISSINFRNYKILRSALRRESPKQILRNFIKLLYKDETQKELISDPLKSIQHATSVINKPILIYITPELPAYDRSSGGRRADQLLHLLTERYEVVCFTHGEKQGRYVNRLRTNGVIVLSDEDIRKINHLYPIADVLVFAWYYTYYDEIQLLKQYPYAKKIIDSIDVHWLREGRQANLDGSISQERLEKNKKREVEAYREVDTVWAVSLPDKEAIRFEIPEAEVHIVSNIHEPIRKELQSSKEPVLFFLGNYNHLPNISAVSFLVDEVFPKILKERPEVQLWIAGANATDEIIGYGDKLSVHYLGYLSDEALAKTYDEVILTVVPLFAGAGVKGKILESIAYMTPVITNALGNEGIDLVDGVHGFVVEDNDLFSDRILEVLSGAIVLKDIVQKAREEILIKVGPEQALKGVYDSLCKQIDICIVTYNKLDLLKTCIESILENTPYPNYRILVHSNGCTDGTREYLKELAQENDKVVPFLSDENDVFVRPNNKLMNLYTDSDVVLLNNDTSVTKDWLSSLHKHACRHDKIGIVGSKILYPDGRLQEYGSEIYEDGTGMNFGKGDDPDDALYQEVKVVPYVSGCALFIKRSTIDVLKGFDDQYHPCYYEDSDLCYRAWKNGIYTIVIPDSIIRHHEGASAGTDTSSGFKQYQAINKEKFVATHKKNLKTLKATLNKAKKELAFLLR